jgi:hypothetical protein
LVAAALLQLPEQQAAMEIIHQLLVVHHLHFNHPELFLQEVVVADLILLRAVE